MPTKRISGAVLGAGLDTEKPTGTEIARQLASALPGTGPASVSEPVRKRGRPSTGGSGMPVTLRIAPDLYASLAAQLPGLAEHGRTMPTVQDLIRALAAAVADEPDTIRKLWMKGRER